MHGRTDVDTVTRKARMECNHLELTSQIAYSRVSIDGERNGSAGVGTEPLLSNTSLSNTRYRHDD